MQALTIIRYCAVTLTSSDRVNRLISGTRSSTSTTPSSTASAGESRPKRRASVKPRLKSPAPMDLPTMTESAEDRPMKKVKARFSMVFLTVMAE